MKKIVVVSGTNRPSSRSLHLANHLTRLYTGLGAHATLLDLVKLPPEVFLPSVYSEKPESLLPWTQSVLESDGMVLVVPEYNGSFPGALKYFIDLLPFPESFEARPVAFVGIASGAWGALRAVEHLQGVFGYRNAHIFPKRVFVPQVHGAMDNEGRPATHLSERLEEQAVAFLDFVGRLRG